MKAKTNDDQRVVGEALLGTDHRSKWLRDLARIEQKTGRKIVLTATLLPALKPAKNQPDRP